MDDWSKIEEIDRQRNSENPWITIAASVTILAIGLGIVFGAWALRGVGDAALHDDSDGSTAARLYAAAWFVLSIGMIFLSGGALWLARGIRALMRGERVRSDQ